MSARLTLNPKSLKVFNLILKPAFAALSTTSFAAWRFLAMRDILDAGLDRCTAKTADNAVAPDPIIVTAGRS
jgi:hypothetical protein